MHRTINSKHSVLNRHSTGCHQAYVGRKYAAMKSKEIRRGLRRTASKGQMKMLLPKRTLSAVLFLIVASLFFLGLYTITDIPVPVSRVYYKLSEPNLSLDLGEIITSYLQDQRRSCHNYYRSFYDTSEVPPSDQLMLYQPPCPLSSGLPDFRYLINQDICGTANSENAQAEIYMLVLVGSHPSHRALRDVIRCTWGNPNITGFPFRLAFLFGQMPSSELQADIDNESKTHRDVIQGSFEDSYRNVMLRDLMGLRWAWQYCQQARFVMHADDDISVDVYSLIDVLQQRFGDCNVTDKQSTDFVGCFQMMVDTPVLRDGRYAVTKEDHPADKYAPYCQGWMYITTPAMAYKLDVAAFRVRPYWLNDAYITGSLLNALGKVPSDLQVNYTIEVSDMQLEQFRDPVLHPTYTVGPTGADPRLTRLLHDKYERFAKINGLPRSRWTRTKPAKINKRPLVAPSASVIPGANKILR